MMRQRLFQFLVFLCLLVSFTNTFAQNFFDPSPKFNKSRMTGVGIAAGAAYVLSMSGLYELWYKDYPQSKFHLFNDNAEWMQMDKGGHCVVAYYLGSLSMGVLKWVGLKKNQYIWYGGMVGAVYNTSFEVLDGFSSEYGFSLGDVTANFAGAAICIGEQLGWGEQRIKLKFSYHHSPESDLRPDLLGSNFPSSAIKDYNGLSDWVSVNINSFTNRKSMVPSWLNMAVGYGGDGMLGARINPTTYKDKNLPTLDRHRQYYLSFDVDLSQINTKSKALNTAFDVLNLIKICAPALEYNRVTKWLFHPLYF